MTDFKTLAGSPVDFDSELARLSGDYDRLNAAISRIEREDAHREAGDTRHGHEEIFCESMDPAPGSRLRNRVALRPRSGAGRKAA